MMIQQRSNPSKEKSISKNNAIQKSKRQRKMGTIQYTKFNQYRDDDDWTFADVDTKYMTHGLHTYPARMIPQVTDKLITKFANLNKKNDFCFDPFMGSGTVLVEAKLKGIKAIGIDTNPLAVLMSKVKTTPISRKTLDRQASILLDAIDADIKAKKSIEIPKIKNLEFWFKPQVCKHLAIIKYNIEKIKNKNVRDFFKLCFSVTVRKTSNIRPGEFKLYRIPPEKLKTYKPSVSKTFLDVVKYNIAKMDEFVNSIDSDVESLVIKGDTRNVATDPNFSKNKATLLITSPPYGDSHTTVAYGQFSRYSSAWLDFDEEEVWKADKISLGGKVFDEISDLDSPTLVSILKKIQRQDAFRAREAYSFFKDMDECFAQIAKVMKKGKSTICFVLGNRTVKRIKVPTDQILIELGKKHGLKYQETYYRDIPNKTMPLNNAPESVAKSKGKTMSEESIVVWKY